MPEKERPLSDKINEADLAASDTPLGVDMDAFNILQDKWFVLLAENLYNSGPRRILTNAQSHLLGLKPLDRGTVAPYLGEEPK